MKVLTLTVAMMGMAFAGEYAVLANGFRIHTERHEIDGAVVRLYDKGSAVTEFPAAQVVSFEQDEAAPALPARPAAAAAKPATVQDPRRLVDAASVKSGLPSAFVHSVVAAESGYQPDAVSPKGAVGLMQLMPDTARAYGANPRDPAQNVEAGAAYLRELLLKYDGDPRRALAAYNAGPGAVSRYNGVPPFPETQNYVERVLRQYKKAIDSQPGSH